MGALTVDNGVGRARVEELASRVGRMRIGQQLDVLKLLTVVGITALPLGFVLIGLGWYGAAHSTYAAQSMSYLISGGIGGIALVITGSAMFFGASLVRQERRLAATLEVLERASASTTDAEARPTKARRSS